MINLAYSRLSGCTSMLNVAYIAKKPMRASPTPVHMLSWNWVISTRVVSLVAADDDESSSPGTEKKKKVVFKINKTRPSEDQQKNGGPREFGERNCTRETSGHEKGEHEHMTPHLHGGPVGSP